MEFSRITFSAPNAYRDKDGKVMEYSYAMPAVKEHGKKGGKDAFLEALSPELETGGYIGEAASAAADTMNAGGIEYSRTNKAKQSNKEDYIRIKEQLNDARETLNKMPPVADINLKGRDGKSDTAPLNDLLAKFGENRIVIDRRGYGKIVFDKKRISRRLNYAKTDGEYAAMFAVPYVLKRGG